jgi:hypothetical protein
MLQAQVVAPTLNSSRSMYPLLSVSTVRNMRRAFASLRDKRVGGSVVSVGNWGVGIGGCIRVSRALVVFVGTTITPILKLCAEP